ncbi:hypothetical protein [Bacillus sp. 1P06AnD]|uniref:hypothetical protein n=1 Tax=Bacillus sp. 1P06AnD TaxID=3132208 RepID=UPI0039A2A268
MKKWYIIVSLLAIGNLFLILYITFHQIKLDDGLQIYSFSGSNSLMSVQDGIIAITPYKQIIYGGNFQYKGEAVKELERANTKLYISFPNKKNNSFWNESHMLNEVDSSNKKQLASMLNGTNPTIAGKKLLWAKDRKNMHDHLFFQMEFQTKNGDRITFPPLKMNVQRVIEENSSF